MLPDGDLPWRTETRKKGCFPMEIFPGAPRRERRDASRWRSSLAHRDEKEGMLPDGDLPWRTETRKKGCFPMEIFPGAPRRERRDASRWRSSLAHRDEKEGMLPDGDLPWRTEMKKKGCFPMEIFPSVMHRLTVAIEPTLPDNLKSGFRTSWLHPVDRKSGFRASGLHPVDREQVLKKLSFTPMNRKRAVGILNAGLQRNRGVSGMVPSQAPTLQLYYLHLGCCPICLHQFSIHR